MKKNSTLSMKKVVALCIFEALMISFFLKSCTAKNNNALAVLELRNQVSSLEAENNRMQDNLIDSQRTIDSLQTELSKIQNESCTVSNTEFESSTNDSSNESEISLYLNNLIKNGTIDSLLKVAESKYSTEDHLIAVASKTSHFNYIFDENAIKIAEALSKNPATTPKVMLELSNSGCSTVRDIGQQYIENYDK